MPGELRITLVALQKCRAGAQAPPTGAAVQTRAQVRLWNTHGGGSDVGVVKTRLQGISPVTWSWE